MMNRQYQHVQVSNIMEPHPHDVLSGRGAGVLKWPGNKKWRELIKDKQTQYLQLKKHEKIYLTQSIVFAVRSLSPPGRFLAKDTRGRWYEIGEHKANEKTAQALREGAPKLRKKLTESSKDSQACQDSKPSPSAQHKAKTTLESTPENPVEQSPKQSPKQSAKRFVSDESLPPFQSQPINNHARQQTKYGFLDTKIPTNPSPSIFQSDPWETYTGISRENDGIGRINLVREIDSEPLKLFNDDMCTLLDEQDAKHLASCLEMPSSLDFSSANNNLSSFVKDQKPPPPSQPATNVNDALTNPKQQQVAPSTTLQKLLQKQRDLFASFVANDKEGDQEKETIGEALEKGKSFNYNY